jgi:hypothetical protein
LANAGHAERLNALSVPAQHAAAELFRGTMTQHRILVYRSDRPDAGQAIQFMDERWHAYVPLRLPWTLCIRERAPPGSVAVLLNRAHVYRDLILPINAAEDRLLAQINGHRTLGEIIARCQSSDDARRALEFFRQLWSYDQIVFDASSAV